MVFLKKMTNILYNKHLLTFKVVVNVKLFNEHQYSVIVKNVRKLVINK